MAPKAQFPGQLTLPLAVGRKKHRRRDEESPEAETVVRKEILLSLQATLANLPHLRLTDPYGVIDQLSFKDLGSVSQWYFTSELDPKSSGHWVAVSSQAWGENFWDVATKHEITFTYLMLLVVHKQMVLSGRTNGRDLFLLQNRLLRLVREGFGNSFASTCPETALTICGLALFALRQGDRVAARAHMTAAQALSAMQHAPNAPCWMICSWIDMFISTAFAWSPFLPYQLPLPTQGSSSSSSHHIEEARKRALRCSKLAPLCRPGFDEREAFELLSQMHEACAAADERHLVTSAPQNLLYDTVFRLCRLSSLTLGDALTQLYIIAIQLSWLSAARFWHPQVGPLRPALLARLDSTLQNTPEIITKWQGSSSLHSLLWVALVGHQNSGRCMPDVSFRFLSVAKPVCQLLGITRLHDLRRHLASFPGLATEKENGITALWADLRPDAPSQWVATRHSPPPCQHTLQGASQSRKFVTIFQFETTSLDDADGPCCRFWMNNWGRPSQAANPS